MAADILFRIPFFLYLKHYAQSLQNEHFSIHGITWRTVQRAALFGHSGQKDTLGMLCQPALRIAGDANHLAAVQMDGVHGGLEFGRFPGIGDGYHHVARHQLAA